MLAFWVITSAKTPEFSSVENYSGSLKKGEYVFNASGCASCHSNPDATQAGTDRWSLLSVSIWYILRAKHLNG